MTDIFISYRRSDAAGHARFFHDRLTRYFDRSRIFFDHESIEAGDVFPDRLRQAASEATALLALIAPDWLDVKDKNENRRLDDPHDYVRQEIALALEQGKVVIPVLIDHDKLPKTSDLPECLKGLLKRDVLFLRDKTSDYDAGLKALFQRLRKIPGIPPSKTPFMAGNLPDDFVPRPEELNSLLKLLKTPLPSPLPSTSRISSAAPSANAWPATSWIGWWWTRLEIQTGCPQALHLPPEFSLPH